MSDGPSSGGLARAFHVLHRVEDTVLALLLGAMIVLAPTQILLRVFFDSGIAWADPLIRVLVLWVGMFGAISASRGDRHITIDVLPRLLSRRPRAAVGVVVHVFTVTVCALLAWHSWRFVQSEREYESVAFADVPAWILEIVLPFAFAVIGIRYALNAVRDGSIALGIREPEPRVISDGTPL